MIAASSPQPMVVGVPNTSSNPEATYVKFNPNWTKLKLKSIDIVHGELTYNYNIHSGRDKSIHYGRRSTSSSSFHMIQLICKSGKNGFLQIDSNIVHDVHSLGIKVGATETMEKDLNENQLSVTTNPTLVHINDEGQNNAATIAALMIDDGQQLNGTRYDVVFLENQDILW
ncbi:hypothetical protein H5410_063168 [Solanum commersonii]|uniref:Uncharacterized protein n=1 Tax=Solanum commersonii TaxID=4109 RepID=A0A9J5WCT8_SOLCO|nr:hypothetical protein H5410_063168 [Solanum commersonii]